MPEPFYASVADIRAALGMDATQLPDAQAIALIEDAEDTIDGMLGARPINIDTGRRVTEADVEPWQWEKLRRATIKTVVAGRSRPAGVLSGRWNSIKGPDFAVSGRLDPSWLPPDVTAILNQSQLAQTTTELASRCARSGRPPWWGIVYNVDPD